MGKVYAVEEGTGRRFLVRIECDDSNCDNSIKPNPQICESGWTKRGNDSGPGTQKDEYYYCPKHGQ